MKNTSLKSILKGLIKEEISNSQRKLSESTTKVKSVTADLDVQIGSENFDWQSLLKLGCKVFIESEWYDEIKSGERDFCDSCWVDYTKINPKIVLLLIKARPDEISLDGKSFNLWWD